MLEEEHGGSAAWCWRSCLECQYHPEESSTASSKNFVWTPPSLQSSSALSSTPACGREKRAAPGSLHRGMNCSTHACWQTLSAKRCHQCTGDAPIKLSGQGPSPCGRGLVLRVREAPGAVPRAASILVAGNVEAVLHGDGDPRAWVVSLRPERYIQVSLAPAGEKPGPCWGSSPGRRVRSNLRSSQNHLWGEAAPSTGGLREG